MSLPLLNRALVQSAAFQARTDVGVPALELLELLDLPERAVQFGTGAFLGGFVGPFLDEANRAGRFNGRTVMVDSTGSGRDRVLAEQDGLYAPTEGPSGLEPPGPAPGCRKKVLRSRARWW